MPEHNVIFIKNDIEMHKILILIDLSPYPRPIVELENNTPILNTLEEFYPDTRTQLNRILRLSFYNIIEKILLASDHKYDRVAIICVFS